MSARRSSFISTRKAVEMVREQFAIPNEFSDGEAIMTVVAAWEEQTREVTRALEVVEAAKRLRDVGPQINMPASSLDEMLEAVERLDAALDKFDHWMQYGENRDPRD